MRQCVPFGGNVDLPYRPIIVSAECPSNQPLGSRLEADGGKTLRRFTDEERALLAGSISTKFMLKTIVEIINTMADVHPRGSRWVRNLIEQ
jgi:hypothetical protein